MNFLFALLAEGMLVSGSLPEAGNFIAKLDYRAVLAILALVIILSFADRPTKGD